MVDRKILLEKGLFPESLPPCFDSVDITRAMQGMISALREKQFRKGRSTKYVRYTGTKHDGNRRPYATPNPIPYFSVCDFIEKNSKRIFRKFSSSAYSISAPRVGSASDDRSIVVSSLSELSGKLTRKIRYAPYILKTDISQFFPSIYTHAIPWVAHGVAQSKADQNRGSAKIYYNRLDWYCQQCQNSQTRGVVIGPDAFRVIAEFIACEIDTQLQERVGNRIVGGVRHVDDYYLGVKSEVDAAIVLSQLRDILQNFELQINDSKTRIISGLEPVDDIWAQDLRAIEIGWHQPGAVQRLLDKAFDASKRLGSESPMKLALRRLDQIKIYRADAWLEVESKLQRIMFHYSHCIDYVLLLLVKRFAIEGSIDKDGWREVTEALIDKHFSFNHHH